MSGADKQLEGVVPMSRAEAEQHPIAPLPGPMDPHDILTASREGRVRLLRQSNINTGDICLKRLGYDMDPTIAGGTGEARIVGTSYHAGLEEYYTQRMLHGQESFAPREDAVAAARAKFAEEVAAWEDGTWDTSEADAAQRCQTMVEAYFDQECWWPLDYEVIGVEQEWFAPLSDGWAVKGAIDLVVRKDDAVTLADHKTTVGRRWNAGKEHPRKNVQAVLYCWAWWRLTGVLPAGMTFDVMTPKGEFERRLSQPTPAHMQAVLDKAVGYTHLLSSVAVEFLPANPSSNLCSERYCDHFAYCPMGRALA